MGEGRVSRGSECDVFPPAVTCLFVLSPSDKYSLSRLMSGFISELIIELRIRNTMTAKNRLFRPSY